MKKAGSKEAFYKVDFTYPYEMAKASHKAGGDRFFWSQRLDQIKIAVIFIVVLKANWKIKFHSLISVLFIF